MKIFKAFFSVSFKKSEKIPVHPTTMFNVLSQTQHYPKFIPFVKKSIITKSISPIQNYTQLTVSYNNFKQLSYTSHVKLKLATNPQEKSTIYSVCREDPLKKLESLWEIQPVGDKNSFVSYKLDYQFVSPFYMLASSMLKDYMGQQLWKIFKQQAIKQQVKVQRQSKISSASASLNNQLEQFLNKNPDIKTVYDQNSKIREKVLQFHSHLQKSPQYEHKMKNQIKNIISRS